MKRTIAWVMGCALILIAAPGVRAAATTWGSPTTISGDTDVDTSGSLVGAFNLGVSGVPATTINGVPFAALELSGNSVTSGNFNLSIATGFAGNNFVGSGNAPFTTLSAAYQAMVGSEAGDFTDPITLTMSGLTSGNSYEFEWWKNVSNGFDAHSAVATAVNSVSLLSNTNAGNTFDGVGQFAIGTFVADGSGTQIITFSATLQDTFNGFQLRDLAASPSAVPLPASLWGGLALLPLVLIARRRILH